MQATITVLLILIVLLLGIKIWRKSADNANASDVNANNVKDNDNSSKASTTSKLDKAKEVAQKSGKKAKGILSAAAGIVSSAFWWGVLIGMGYLFISFGYSIYQDASDFMSSNPTVATNNTPSAPILTNRIIDGDYVPDKKDGTYIFTMDANKSYRIQVSGCNLQVRVDGKEYKIAPYTFGVCADGTDTSYRGKYFFTKGFDQKAIMPNEHWALAILVVKKGGRIIKKLPIGGNLYTLDGAEFPNNSKAYLYVNLSIHETVSGEWHVVVDEI